MRCRSSLIAAVIAATDFSRPTPSGTTSFGKTTISRSGTSARFSGNSRSVVGFVILASSVISLSFPVCAWVGIRTLRQRCLSKGCRLAVCRTVAVLVGRVGQLLQEIGDVVELEEHLHTGEIHATCLREVPDHPDPMKIVVGIEADVRVGPHRLEQAL